MATYRGMDGSVSLATNVVAETFGWTFNGELQTLEDTVQGDVARTYKPGLAGWTAAVRARFDYGDTTGQKAIYDELLGVSPQGDLADLRLRLSGTKYISGAAVVTGATITAELGNIIEANLTFQGSGPASMTWS